MARRTWGSQFGRRQWLGGSLASLAAACGASGQAGVENAEVPSASDEFVIRGGQVVTMDKKLGDLPEGDVYVKQGIIYEVGPKLTVPQTAQVIDAEKKIVLPGLIDTHSHLWPTQTRGLFGQEPGEGLAQTLDSLGKAYEPGDMEIGVRLGALESLNAGITSVCVFCDNVRSREHAQAALSALSGVGVRHRFTYASAADTPPEQPADLAHVKELLEASSAAGPADLRSFALGVRLPEAGVDHVSAERARREIMIARSMKLPISALVGGESAQGQLAFLFEDELLGDDLQLVHVSGGAAEQLAQLEQAGVAVTLTPVGEQRSGFGLTQLSDYEPHLSRLGLGCDGTGLSGRADLFAVMRSLHDVQSAVAKQQLAVLPRRTLELATLGGARVMGLQQHVGSLVPGKRADIVLLDTQQINTVWSRQGDPAAHIVYSADPANVEAVWVDGKLAKWGGQLVNVDLPQLFQKAEESIWSLRERAAKSAAG